MSGGHAGTRGRREAPPDILGKCIGRHNALRRHNPVDVTPEAIGYRFGADLGGWRYIRFQDIRRISVIRASLRGEGWQGYQVLVGSEKGSIPLFVDKNDKGGLVDALTRMTRPPGPLEGSGSNAPGPATATKTQAPDRSGGTVEGMAEAVFQRPVDALNGGS